MNKEFGIPLAIHLDPNEYITMHKRGEHYYVLETLENNGFFGFMLVPGQNLHMYKNHSPMKSMKLSSYMHTPVQINGQARDAVEYLCL